LVDADFRSARVKPKHRAPRAHTRTPSTPNADTHVTMNALCASPVVAPQFAGAKKSFSVKKVRAGRGFPARRGIVRNERASDFARSRRFIAVPTTPRASLGN
jgi:hypothetical protein|tara:strand:+ start:269 stop:574 length:306 start_codon:yes stop_codon:yes gene_type:complete